jgi:hypothetical protein
LTAAFVVLATGLHHSKSVYAREGMKNAGADLPAKAAVMDSSTV